MPTQYRAGSVMRLTEDGTRLIVWSQGPRPGTYWCHVAGREDRKVVLVQVRNTKTALEPVITLEEGTL